MSFKTYLSLYWKIKRILPVIIVFSVMILFSGCEKEHNDKYYYVLGDMHVTTDSALIISDDNERLLISNRSGISSVIKDKDRIYAYFTINDKKISSDTLYIISLYSIEKVLMKPIFVLTPGTLDSIGNDPLSVRSLWITKKYLNLSFRYFGNNQKHYINLTRQEGSVPVDTISLEIRHNNKNDEPFNEIYALVSFDLASIQNTLKDSVILHITAKEFEDRNYEKYLTYKY
jgi:hypothetical protein